jgi:ribosomal protein S27AE
MTRQTVIDLSKYTFQKTDKSFCPCGANVFLLMSKDMHPNDPAFYLCAKCGSIAQVGVGEISPPEKERA